jgi:hypothetical protein
VRWTLTYDARLDHQCDGRAPSSIRRTFGRHPLRVVHDAQERTRDHHFFNGDQRIGDRGIMVSLRVSESQVAHFRFTPDTRHITASHRLASYLSDPREARRIAANIAKLPELSRRAVRLDARHNQGSRTAGQS